MSNSVIAYAFSRLRALALLISLSLFSWAAQSQVFTQKSEDGWQLIVDDKPFTIKGVTFGYTNDVENYDKRFKDLQFLGVNTIRTWGTDDNTPELLDAAERHRIKVMVGIWMRHGKPGAEGDDRFNYLEDEEGKEEMFKSALETVEKYKNHPAVLTWGVGNEVYLNMATDAEKLEYSKFLERVCAAIKQKDASHPITSVEAWTFGMDWWIEHVPSLDIYGLNSYGPGVQILGDEMVKRDIDKPYLIAEFGVTGEWDIKKEVNGVKQEPDDEEKYSAIMPGCENWILNKPNSLGVFVFHYADTEEFVGPWLLTHFNQKTRPQYWAIREAFTGEKPLNQVPEIGQFSTDATEMPSGSWIRVNLEATDAEEEDLKVYFRYNQRKGTRRSMNQILPLEYRGNLSDGFEIKLPKEDGPVKIYAIVEDEYGNAGIGTTGIKVIDEEVRKRGVRIIRPGLPFNVYDDSGDDPYISSAYMGNMDALKVDGACQETVQSGKTSIKVSYQASNEWFGLGWVDPVNDWGDNPGGYDLSGAEKFSFWAKASRKGVKVEIGFGLIDDDKPYPDTAKRKKEVYLSTEWKKYSISTKRLDMSCIRSGLVIFGAGDGEPFDIYLDEVVLE
jgi:hypothetical protein